MIELDATGARRVATLELLGVVALLEAFLWGRGRVPLAWAVFGVPLFALTTSAHWRRGERAKDIGLSFDRAAYAFRLLLPVIIAVAIALMISGASIAAMRLQFSVAGAA